MEKILSWLNDFKSFFSSEVSKISNAQAELATVSEKLAGATSYIAKCEEKITALSADLEKAQAEAKEAAGKAQAAEEKAEAAEKKAHELLANQGLAQDHVPAAEANDIGNPAKPISNLVGLDRVKAAFAAQLNKK